MKNEVKNPYVMVDVDQDNVLEISRAVESILKDLDIPYTRLHNSHISLAYMVGEHKKEFLKDLLSEIAEDSFAIKAIGIKILEGKTTDQDYVVLLLETESDDFEYAHELIKETCEVKTFDGKFTAHLSLFSIDKGTLSPEDYFTLCRVIEIHGSDILSSIKIKGKSVAVYNEDRTKEIEEKLPEN